MKKYLLIFCLLLLCPLNILATVYPAGDIDGNGIVETNDCILIRKYLLKSIELTDEMLKRADVNEQNGITVQDYIKIRRIMLGLEKIPTPTPTITITPTIFDQRNDAIIEYLKAPSANQVKIVNNTFGCGKSYSCDQPKVYNSSLTGNVNIYRYDDNQVDKELIATVDSKDIYYYLVPNSTYYLESESDKNKVEAVTITGNLRMISASLGNFRDLGGWNADGGTVKYGKLFRSANTNSLTSLSQFVHLGINRVVDLRQNSEINSSSAVESIRQRISITYYTTGTEVYKAVSMIMKAIVEEKKNALFNCNIGRDRTGTIAYIIEGILGVSLDDRKTDFELTYLYEARRTRDDVLFKSLISKINKYSQTTYEQERFINWYLSNSNNKEADLNLINNFRKEMINGNPHMYKLVNNKAVLN